MIGYVMFELAGRELACRLDEVREVVRLSELDALPGLRPPISGLLELRGTPLPVVDLRSHTATTPARRHGDVLVLAGAADDREAAMGMVVDRVTAVRDDDELEPAVGPTPRGLPSYVVEVLRRPGNTTPVLLVDLHRLMAIAA